MKGSELVVVSKYLDSNTSEPSAHIYRWSQLCVETGVCGGCQRCSPRKENKEKAYSSEIAAVKLAPVRVLNKIDQKLKIAWGEWV